MHSIDENEVQSIRNDILRFRRSRFSMVVVMNPVETATGACVQNSGPQHHVEVLIHAGEK